jgi:hypothetical protein
VQEVVVEEVDPLELVKDMFLQVCNGWFAFLDDQRGGEVDGR